VAAIAREAAYRRSFTSTLFGRLLSWLGHLWRRTLGLFGTSLDLRGLAIIVAVLLVVTVVVRMFVAARAAAADTERARGRTVAGRPGDPWSDAQRLASEGRFTAAAHALYGALLARLAGRGAVRLHPSKTAGDYARELRRRDSPDQYGFQAFRVRYDRVIYGSGICTADDFSALLREAQPLLERAA